MKYATLPSRQTIDKTLGALKERGITGQFADTKEQALEKLKSSIPAGAELMTGGSTTLQQIGFIDYLKSGEHAWKNLKDELLREENKSRQAELRKKSILAGHFVGSVHALTESGQLLIASATGSQIAPYAYASDNIIWVVGAHKIVPDIEEGIRRIREHSLPLEDQRMKNAGYSGSHVGMILIVERPLLIKRTMNLILVNQVLGF
jgi:L-lactate utilization protein LutC